MKITLSQPAPARVALPCRLRIRDQDLNAFQANTLSHSSSTDAHFDFGPEDFADDDERLAARDLAVLLQREDERAHTGFFQAAYHRSDSLMPGRIDLEVAYPFDESAIRQSALAVIRTASEQRKFVAHVTQACADYSTLTAARLEEQVDGLLKKYAEPLSASEQLEAQIREAIKRLDGDFLMTVPGQYKKLAGKLPSSSIIHDALKQAVATFPVAEARTVFEVNEDSLPWIGSYSESHLLRTSHNPPRVELEIHVSDCLPGSVRSWKTRFSLSITGLFIFPVRQKVDFRLVGLGRLFMAKANAEVLSRGLPEEAADPLSWDNDAPPVNAYRNDSLAADISSALAAIERKKLAEDMAQWIATEGSESLRLGSEQRYSMTRQYRMERAAKILDPLLGAYPGWKLLLEADVSRKAAQSLKASPSERALKSLVAIKEHSPDARVCYAENLTDTIRAQFGEFISITAGSLFPGAPGYVIYWQSEEPPRKTRRKAG